MSKIHFPRTVINQLPERFIIAYDGRWHVRETLYVHHNDINGEVQYWTEPLSSGDTIHEAIMNSINLIKLNKEGNK